MTVIMTTIMTRWVCHTVCAAGIARTRGRRRSGCASCNGERRRPQPQPRPRPQPQIRRLVSDSPPLHQTPPHTTHLNVAPTTSPVASLHLPLYAGSRASLSLQFVAWFCCTSTDGTTGGRAAPGGYRGAKGLRGAGGMAAGGNGNGAGSYGQLCSSGQRQCIRWCGTTFSITTTTTTTRTCATPRRGRCGWGQLFA